MMVFVYALMVKLYTILVYLFFVSLPLCCCTCGLCIMVYPYVGSIWLRGGPRLSETSWTCILGREDMVFPFIVSFLALCIVLTDS